MKKQLDALEQKLAAQEKPAPSAPAAQPAPAEPTAAAAAPAAPAQPAPSNASLEAQINDLDTRISKNEMHTALDRLNFSGDERYEFHSIYEHVPAFFNGLALESNIANAFGISPTDPNYFSDLKTAVQTALAGLTPAQQQAMLANFLPPVTNASHYNNNALQTLRLRLNFGAKVANNVTVRGRLAMYKVFGDSDAVQVFNGMPNSLDGDGNTARVPNSDIVRVERAFMNWNNIGGSPVYISVGRRPSTDGPPMNLRQDELRGGTPMGSLIDYQFDGVSIGWHISDVTTAHLCYGVGFDSGFGSNQFADAVFNQPGSSISDVHLLGTALDLYNTDTTFVQALYAHAFNVTDGFNGLTAFTVNPVTGQSAPVNGEQAAGYNISLFQPSANLGGINLAGILVQRRFGPLDLFGNAAWDGLRPNGLTTPFGGIGSDPFEVPTNHDGWFVYAGARYHFPDHKTKLGFEYNHGSKYWFNFTQGADDIVLPKTSIRGNAYEAYLTHEIRQGHFIMKVDYIHYGAQYSGSGWDVGAPHRLSGENGGPPILGFPSFDTADMASGSLVARF